MTLRPTFSDIKDAARRLNGIAVRTSVLTSAALDAAAGAAVFVKCENLQSVGAFKIRGAYNALAQLSDEAKVRGVVAFSSGNHAQGVALAAKLLGIEATIVMPADASKVKLDATRAYGARVVTYDQATENREAIAAGIVEQSGAALIPPYDHLDVIAGQGTAALELCEDVADLDAVVTPVGGGGLLAGTATAVKGMQPTCAVYGVEPELGNDWWLSWRAGRRVEIAPPKTIAEGVRVTTPGKLTWEIARERADGIVLVSDQEIRDAMRFAAAHLKIVTEPAGATVIAAAMYRRLPKKCARIGLIVSGGNVDMATFATLCADGTDDAGAT
jgi:threonine dehydratase